MCSLGCEARYFVSRTSSRFLDLWSVFKKLGSGIWRGRGALGERVPTVASAFSLATLRLSGLGTSYPTVWSGDGTLA